MARSKAESLYNVLQGAMTQSDSSMSFGPPLPKRHRLMPTAVVSCLTAQETEAAALDPLIQELEVVHQNRGALSYLSPTSRRQHIKGDGTPMCHCRGHPVGLLLPGQRVP